ncbi:MAG: peptidylprolyl isomerase [Pseudomonadota bacterium]
MTVFSLRRSAAVCAVVAAIAAPAAFAQTDDPENQVVATVNGAEIYMSDVMDALVALPPQYQQFPPEMMIGILADQLATGRLIEQRALDEGLGEDPEVLDLVEQARLGIIQEVWLGRVINERATDDRLAAAYDAFLEQNPPYDEVSARHILVETEEEALAAIERLQAGEDFATLAGELSIGPSSTNGGDLGYFQQGQMVEPFGETAFALEDGAFTTEPVETQFGWHVILTEDHRTVEPPALEEVRGQLVDSVSGEIAQEIAAELREGAEIVVFGPDGEPIEQ